MTKVGKALSTQVQKARFKTPHEERKGLKSIKVTFIEAVADIPPLGDTISVHKNAVPQTVEKVILIHRIKQLEKVIVDLHSRVAEVSLANKAFEK